MADEVLISRRTWLKGMGLAGAVALAQPALLAAVGPSLDTVSLPSRIHAVLADGAAAPIEAGLRRGLAAHPGVQLTIHTTSGYSSATKAAVASALTAGAELIIVHAVSAGMTPILPLIYAAGRPIISLSLGEDITPIVPDPLWTNVSLDQWQATWALGSWAAETYGPGRALIAAAPYEAAYDALDAFPAAYTLAGGSIAAYAFAEADALDLPTLVREHRPDVIYAAYSGAAARRFAQQYQASAAGIPLLTSPFTLWSAPIGGAVSASTWAPNLNTGAATMLEWLGRVALDPTTLVAPMRDLHLLDERGHAIQALKPVAAASAVHHMHKGVSKVGATHPYLAAP